MIKCWWPRNDAFILEEEVNKLLNEFNLISDGDICSEENDPEY